MRPSPTVLLRPRRHHGTARTLHLLVCITSSNASSKGATAGFRVTPSTPPQCGTATTLRFRGLQLTHAYKPHAQEGPVELLRYMGYR